MSIEIIEKLLTKFNWEYRINCGKTVINSPNYFEYCKNKIYTDIFQYGDKYYINKVKFIDIDNINYKIEYLEDVTKYIEFILALKKDKLTGLATRENLDNYISKLNEDSVFVLCDIDDFKKVNDTYGHVFGDKILSILGKIIRQNIRHDDFAGRYGGEEFLIIFNTSDIQAVKKRVSKMNRKFNENSMNLNLSFSAGISRYDGTKKVTDVVKEADIALYYVKNHGKNNSAIFNDDMKM